MLVANYYNNKDIRIEERPVPTIGKGECLIKIYASGICGSDVMEWYRIKKAPIILGHEIAGEIVDIDRDVTEFKIGDKVVASHHVPCMECRNCLRGHETTCNTIRTTTFDPGGFSQYVRLPEINTRLGLYKIPDNVSFEEASFAEPLACVSRGLSRTRFKEGDVVAVIGSGLSGILYIALAKSLGVERILAVDISPKRLELAEKFGADITTSQSSQVASLSVEKGHKPDVVIVATGNPKAILDGLNAVNDGGSVLLFAPTDPGITVPFDVNSILWGRDIMITTSYAGTPQDHRNALKLISNKFVPVKDMITHRLSLEETQLGFELVTKGSNSLKVIIEPNKSQY